MSGINLDRAKIFPELHKKFGSNIAEAMANCEAGYEEAEIKARSIISIADALKLSSRSVTQTDIISLFEEIFSDLVCSVYLSSAALDVPAKMLLRRALELGIAVLYLWDVPHIYWAWKELDCDLNFKQMIETLSSEQYCAFVKKENPEYDSSQIIDAAKCNKLYRKLSNVSHGKSTSFESYNPSRFAYCETEWKEHVSDVQAVESIIISAWKKRDNNVAQSAREVLAIVEKA